MALRTHTMDGHDKEVDHALAAAARLAKNGFAPEALSACDLMLRNDPCNGAVWRMRAHLLARQRAWSPAIDCLARIGDASSSPTDRLSTGRWRLEAGDFIGAIADFSTLLACRFDEEVRPWLALARLLRAIAQLEAGLYSNAVRDCLRLPGTSCLRVRGRRWRVSEIRREADAALRTLPIFPRAR